MAITITIEVPQYTIVIIYKIMSREILEKFGEKVRDERIKQHLTQEELAEKAGVHRTYIGMIERAEKNITLENINKIAKALGIKINKIFEGL